MRMISGKIVAIATQHYNGLALMIHHISIHNAREWLVNLSKVVKIETNVIVRNN